MRNPPRALVLAAACTLAARAAVGGAGKLTASAFVPHHQRHQRRGGSVGGRVSSSNDEPTTAVARLFSSSPSTATTTDLLLADVADLESKLLQGAPSVGRNKFQFTAPSVELPRVDVQVPKVELPDVPSPKIDLPAIDLDLQSLSSDPSQYVPAELKDYLASIDWRALADSLANEAVQYSKHAASTYVQALVGGDMAVIGGTTGTALFVTIIVLSNAQQTRRKKLEEERRAREAAEAAKKRKGLSALSVDFGSISNVSRAIPDLSAVGKNVNVTLPDARPLIAEATKVGESAAGAVRKGVTQTKTKISVAVADLPDEERRQVITAVTGAALAAGLIAALPSGERKEKIPTIDDQPPAADALPKDEVKAIAASEPEAAPPAPSAPVAKPPPPAPTPPPVPAVAPGPPVAAEQAKQRRIAPIAGGGEEEDSTISSASVVPLVAVPFLALAAARTAVQSAKGLRAQEGGEGQEQRFSAAVDIADMDDDELVRYLEARGGDDDGIRELMESFDSIRADLRELEAWEEREEDT